MTSQIRKPRAFQTSQPLTSAAPFKTLWITLNILIMLFIRLPIVSIYYLPSVSRPNQKWTWRQAIMVNLLKNWFQWSPSARIQWTESPDHPSGSKEAFALIKGLPREKLQGPLVSPDVAPAPRPASWYPGPYNAQQDDSKKILLYFFGGAYVAGGHDPTLYKATFERLRSALSCKILSVGYRLSSTEGNHFPAALQDAMAAYQYLIDLGVPSRQIILIGDSVGGHLVLSMLRYMADYPSAVTHKPAAAVLASPWVDMTGSPSDILKHPTYSRDIVTSELVDFGISAFVPGDKSLADPYISPRLHPFRLGLPVWIEADTSEVNFDVIKDCVKGLDNIPDNDVRFHESAGGTHCTLTLGDILGFETQISESVTDIKGFVDARSI